MLMATSESGMGLGNRFGGWERDRERRYETLAFATASDRPQKDERRTRLRRHPP